MMDGSPDLIAAIFERAMMDGCAPCLDAITRSGSKRIARDLMTTKQDAMQAWTFLTQPAGEWADHRNWLAGLMGSTGDYVREIAIRRGPSRAARIAMGERPAAAPQPHPDRVGKGFPWTDAERERLRQLAADGADLAEMSLALNRAARGIEDQLRAMKIKPAKVRKMWAKNEIDLLLAWFAEGRSSRAIARDLGRPVKSIERRIRDMGLREQMRMAA
jgi:hypothetical protein